MNDIPESVSKYMAKIGAKGGRKGKGTKKKRSSLHYKKVLGDIHRKRAAKKKES
jgi:hypothetical protein